MHKLTIADELVSEHMTALESIAASARGGNREDALVRLRRWRIRATADFQQHVSVTASMELERLGAHQTDILAAVAEYETFLAKLRNARC